MASTRAQILIRFSSLGDLVLCSALLQNLQKTRPSETPIFISSSSFQDFLESSFPQPLKVVGLKTGLFGYFVAGYRLAKALFKDGIRNFEIFDLHGVAKSAALIWGFRIFCARHKSQLKVQHSEKKSLLRSLSVFFSKDLLGKRFIYKSHLKLSASASNESPSLRVAAGVERSKNRVLIAADAKHWKKRWIIGHWEKLIGALLQEPEQYSITLVGGRDALPHDIVDDLMERFPRRIENRLGQSEVTELSAIAAAHALTICGNSAWLHISEAVGTPVVSLPGPIVSGFGFSPWMKDSLELDVKLKCRPCTKHGGGLCRNFGDDFHACMKLVSPERVLEAVRTRLKVR